MSKRRRRKHKDDDAVTTVLGVAWYRRQQWDRLREISADKDTLEETYDEWKANAESRIPDLERDGYVLHKVDIDVDELLRWCDSQGCPVDGEARSLFAAAKLREMDR